MREKHSEQLQATVTTKEVWGSFEKFQIQAVRGFSTVQERLGEYAHLLHTFSSYFNQTHSISQTDATDLVEKLFFHSADASDAPIAFFSETAEKLREKGVESWQLTETEKYRKNVFDIISDSVIKELAVATKNFNLELTERNKLEALVANAPTDERLAILKSELACLDEQRREVQKNAIALLSKDPETAARLQEKDNCLDTINNFLGKDSYSREDLEQIRHYAPILKKPDGSFVSLDDLLLRVSFGQTRPIKRDLEEVKKTLSDPSYTWSYLVETGDIPSSLLDSFDEVITFSRLQQASQVSASLPKNLRAQLLKPFLEDGISASMLIEIIEDKYDFSSDIVAGWVDAFIHMYDQIAKKEKQPMSRQQKIVIAAMVGLLALSPFGYNAYVNRNNISISQLAEAADKASQIDEHVVRAPRRSPPSSPYSPKTSKKEKAEINSAEGFKEANKKILWQLKDNDVLAGNLTGYYRTSTSTYYDSETRAWSTSTDVKDFGSIVVTERKDIEITEAIHTPGVGEVELPVKNGMAVTKDSIRINGQVPSFFGLGTLPYPNLYQAVDGTYFIEFSQRGDTSPITLSYSIGKTDVPFILEPSEFERAEMTTQIMDVSLLPADTKKLLSDLSKRNDIPTLKKAHILEEYIKLKFLYTLDTRWADYYDQAASNDEKFARAFESKRADCDVANEALVALLRAQGIPARMVSGFRHTGDFLGGKSNELVGSEAHGWTEAFINSSWVTFDATPLKKDEFTKKALVGEDLGGGDSLHSWDDFFRALSNMRIKGRLAWNNYEFVFVIMTGLLLSAGSMGVDFLIRRNNSALAQKLRIQLNKRAKAYLGDEYDEVYNYLIRRESLKIEKNEDEPSWEAAVPALGFLRTIPLLIHRMRLEKLPYKKGEEKPRQSDIPDSIEFLSQVLGFNEAEVEKTLFENSSEILKMQTIRDAHSKIAELFEQAHFMLPDTNKQIRFAVKLFDMMSKPKGKTPDEWEEDWQKMKEEITTYVYRTYRKVHNKEMKKAAKAAAKHKTTFTPRSPMTEEQLTDAFNDVFRYKLVLWQMEEAEKEATQSKRT